jgi:adenylate cyclase
MSLLEELQRRNVVRMAVLYTVASWLILQVADVLFEQLGVPGWAFRLVLGLLILGFPIAIIFAWVFELTPEGLKREREIDRHQSITTQTGKKFNITIIVLLILAISGLIADRLIPENTSPATPAITASGKTELETPTAVENKTVSDSLSIAVLPFVNMSGDPENEYFSDGLSEELLNTLVQIRELKVTGRTSSFAFKGRNVDLREVGQRLNVANVLEGSVRKAANRVRITAQLIKTNDGYHLWSETFDRELDDIFAIQQEIAEHVARALSVTLLGDSTETSGETQNPEAYQLYLRGSHRYQRAPDDLDNLNAALKFYQDALALDPDYRSAQFGLFQYWQRMNRNGHVDFDISKAQMKDLASRLQLNWPDSIEALSATSVVSLTDFNWPQTMDIMARAHKLYPGSAPVNIGYASTLWYLGREEEALNSFQTAIDLDPLSSEALTRLAYMSTQQGNCEKVERIGQVVLEIQPGVGRVHGYMAYCLLLTDQDPSLAMQWLEKEPIGFLRKTGMAIALHRLERQEDAQSEMEFMLSNYGESASYQYAQVYSQWGETELALKWLSNALDIRDPGVLHIGLDHFLDPIRKEPRFQELIQQAGMTQYYPQ